MKVVFCIDDNPRYLMLLKVAVRSLRAVQGVPRGFKTHALQGFVCAETALRNQIQHMANNGFLHEFMHRAKQCCCQLFSCARQGCRSLCGSPAGDATASPEAAGFVGAKCGSAAEAALRNVYDNIAKLLHVIFRAFSL